MSDLSKNIEIFQAKDDNELVRPTNRKRKKIKVFQLIIIGGFLIFIFFLLFIHFYYQSVIRQTLDEEEVFQLDKIIELETAKERIVIENYKPVSPRFIRTFGDNFSSLAAINTPLTDMYWDSQVAAFLFPPRLSMKKVADCTETACGHYIHDDNWQGFCNAESCLERLGQSLIFDGEDLALPKEIDRDRLISVSLGGVGSDWYLGFIFGDDNKDQEAWIYRFDGLDFYPLITEETDISFDIRPGARNGHLAFGGQPDSLLIVYGGYYGKIIRLEKEQEIVDLSIFFSLRLSSTGFFPNIQKSEKVRAIYICNSRPNRNNILKLWHDDQGKIIGAVDLQSIAIIDRSARRIACLPGEEDSDLTLLIENRTGWEKWLLYDQGFNNKIIRQVVSNNFNSSDHDVRAAVFSSFSINSEKTWTDTFQLYFTGDGKNYTPVLPGNWFRLEEPGNNLFWRIIFKTSDDPYYSPWFNNVNIINYEIIVDEEEI